jgi:hypothetical protein
VLFIKRAAKIASQHYLPNLFEKFIVKAFNKRENPLPLLHYSPQNKLRKNFFSGPVLLFLVILVPHPSFQTGSKN